MWWCPYRDGDAVAGEYLDARRLRCGRDRPLREQVPRARVAADSLEECDRVTQQRAMVRRRRGVVAEAQKQWFKSKALLSFSQSNSETGRFSS